MGNMKRTDNLIIVKIIRVSPRAKPTATQIYRVSPGIQRPQKGVVISCRSQKLHLIYYHAFCLKSHFL